MEKSCLDTIPQKHYVDKFIGIDSHWYDVNDIWTFADEYVGKPMKIDIGCMSWEHWKL